MPPSQSKDSVNPRNSLNSDEQPEKTDSPPVDGLKTLFGAINALKEDTSYRELANLVKEVEALRTELESKQTTIKQLETSKEEEGKKFESTKEVLLNEHHKHYTKLKAHRDGLANEATALRETVRQRDESRKTLEDQHNQTQAEIAKLKEALNSSNAYVHEERQKYIKLERDFKTAKNEIDKLKADSRQKESEMNKLKESNLSLEKKHNDMRQSLNSSKEELERLRGLAVELRAEPLATTKERLDNLWREALFMVNKHFRFKLPEASEQNVELSKRLKDVSNRYYVSDQIVPLPRRDSVATRNMRCALVLAWLLRLVVSELFQPNYIIPADSGIRNYLVDEAWRDSRSESFRRAFLLSLFQEEQTRILDERAASVFDRIMQLVQGIIDNEQAAALRSDLQGFIKLTCTVWQDIQRLRDRFEPSMDYTVDDSFDWTTIPLEDSEGSKSDGASASSISDEPVLVVFPRIYIVKDAEPKPVTPGIVLMKSQTVVAAQEVRSETPKSPTFGRGPATFSRDDRRRDSIIMNNSLANRNAGAFLGQGVPNGEVR